jgi:hypothetical protein
MKAQHCKPSSTGNPAIAPVPRHHNVPVHPENVCNSSSDVAAAAVAHRHERAE